MLPTISFANILFLVALVASPLRAGAQQDASLWPPWIPLAVRSPYFQAWMNATNIPLNLSDVDARARTPTHWPSFLTGQLQSWSGAIRVSDSTTNTTYAWIGDLVVPDQHRPILNNIQITPTRTIMTMTAGPVDVTATLLSPIEPADPVLQSLSFTYVTLDIVSNDGLEHQVQVYSDIDGEWLTGNRNQVMNWTNAETTDELMYYQLQLQTPLTLSETQNQAEDDTIFWAMPKMPAQTFMIDTGVNCRAQFIAAGTLPNNVAITGPEPIVTGHSFAAFAFSADLGTISATKSPIIFTLGMTRNPSIGVVDADGTPQQRSPYWASSYSQSLDAASFFLGDYANAITRAIALDQKIQTAAGSISAHYSNLVSLAARQAMSGTDLTVGRSTSDPSQWNTSDVKMYMKNLGIDGRVNPVEGLYQIFPFFLVVNATLGGWLLEPVLEFSNTSRWAFPYAPRDIGLNYPNATGDSEPHDQGVEQSGNMLIMILAYARATGDGSLLARYYSLLKQWANYLVGNSFPLANTQVSPDANNGAKILTNLALKGIIGIRAMSDISSVMGIDDDTQHYSNVSSTFAAQWQAQAVSSDGTHILTSFGDADSSLVLTYNLFADMLLQTDVISPEIYSSQTDALTALVASSQSSSGLPIDNGLSSQSNAVWSLFAAAYVNNTATQQSIIDQIWQRVATNGSDIGIFSPVWGLDGNSISPQTGSPLVGGVLALLSLNVPNTTIIGSTHEPVSTSTSAQANPSKTASSLASQKSSNVGAIVGGVVGGLGGAACLILVGFLLWRKQHPRTRSSEAGLTTQPSPFVDAPSYARPSENMVEAPRRSSGPALVSRKEIERLLASRDISSSNPSSSANISIGGMSQNPSTASSGPPASHSEVQALFTEMENLRRVVQTIRDPGLDSPPEYRSESGL